MNVQGAKFQSYGAGSEYGSAARQEARRKKYGRQMQKFQIDAQPWQLSIRYESKFPLPYSSEGMFLLAQELF